MSLFLHRGGLLKPAGGGSTTETKDIAANDDDAYSSANLNGFFQGDDALLAGVQSSSDFTAGLRFTGFSSSLQGASVSSATLTINIVDVLGSPDLDVYGEDADSAAAWSSGRRPGDITKTTNSKNITPSSTGSLDIDVKDIVQEIVNRSGWSSDIAFGILNNAGGSNNSIDFDAHEKSGGTPASLEVTWS